jgi:threonylcarbamoyladenosine tRNA methylthiotransferase MtaB
VIGINRLDALVDAVTAPAPALGRITVDDSRRATRVSTFGARTFPGQTRAFLKVQEGCDLFCTFCIVPMARGKSRSLAPREVLAEMEGLAAQGFEEVVLTGVHLGGYGEDPSPHVDLVWLVEALAEQGLFTRIRLSSIDPHDHRAARPPLASAPSPARTCTCRCRRPTTGCCAACAAATTRRSPPSGSR